MRCAFRIPFRFAYRPAAAEGADATHSLIHDKALPTSFVILASQSGMAALASVLLWGLVMVGRAPGLGSLPYQLRPLSFFTLLPLA